MSDHDRVPDIDGPLYGATLRRAREVDDADSPEERRRAWIRLVGVGLLAVAEHYLRHSLIWGAVLFSGPAAAFGVSSGHVEWAVAMVVGGVVGIVLVFVALARQWSFGRQWAVLLGVLGTQGALLVAVWLGQ